MRSSTIEGKTVMDTSYFYSLPSLDPLLLKAFDSHVYYRFHNTNADALYREGDEGVDASCFCSSVIDSLCPLLLKASTYCICIFLGEQYSRDCTFLSLTC